MLYARWWYPKAAGGNGGAGGVVRAPRKPRVHILFWHTRIHKIHRRTRRGMVLGGEKDWEKGKKNVCVGEGKAGGRMEGGLKRTRRKIRKGKGLEDSKGFQGG